MNTSSQVNESSLSVRSVVEARARLLEAVRAFFDERGFVEVQTPCLGLEADCAPHLESFRTSTEMPDGSQVELFLNTSPELYMKRLLAEGLEKIYQICPFFRRGEISRQHNPEYIGLEWYHAGIDLEGFMEVTEQLLRACGKALGATRGPQLPEGRFPRMTLHQAFRKCGGIELPDDFDPDAIRRVMSGAGIRFSDDDEPDDLVNRVLVERVEAGLAGFPAVFITEYPAFMAALARLHPERPWVAERFELYLGGFEIANGYHELCDPAEQRSRFEQQRQLRMRKGRYVPQVDEAFLDALERGVPDCCGCALGVDRLLMVLLGAQEIGEVMPFSLERELARRRMLGRKAAR